MPKRRIFISFDHDDTQQVNGFLGLRNVMDGFEFYNHKLDHRINSANDAYVKSVIKAQYITPASVTVVLIGARTAASGWVKWEISTSVQEGKGLLGIVLPHSSRTQPPNPAGIPQGAVGSWQPEKFQSWIEWAAKQAGK